MQMVAVEVKKYGLHTEIKYDYLNFQNKLKMVLLHTNIYQRDWLMISLLY